MLHIGAGQVISRADIVIILPKEGNLPAQKGAVIMLRDGTVVESVLSAKTLQERLNVGALALKMGEKEIRG